MSMRVANPTINPTGLNANQMLQFGLARSAVKLVESGKLSEANQLLKLVVDPNEIPNKTSEIEELLSIGGEDARIKFRELTKLSEEPAGVQKFKDTEKVMARAKEVMGSNNERQEDDLIRMDLGINWDYYFKRMGDGLSFKEDRKKDILSLIRIMVMSIVNSNKELFETDGSNLSSSPKKFHKPYLINGERISLQRLYQWERGVRRKKEDGSEYSVKEIMSIWKRSIFGIDLNEGIAVLPVDIEIPELRRMSLLHIHSLVWSIVMYGKDYNGEPSKVSSYQERFQKPYLINGERISLRRLYCWEKRVRGKKEDGSEYSKKEIISTWKNEIDWSHGFLHKKNGKGVVVSVRKNEIDDPTLTPILNSSRLLSRLITNQDYRLKIKGELLKRWIRPYEYNVGKTILLINKLRDDIENESVKALIEEVVNEIGKYGEMD